MTRRPYKPPAIEWSRSIYNAPLHLLYALGFKVMPTKTLPPTWTRAAFGGGRNHARGGRPRNGHR